MSITKTITFSELGLNSSLLNTLTGMGFENPTPVQAKAIPLVLSAKDVIVKAQTGTGKTAAFALPILHHIDVKKRTPQALILAPTRELAMQVSDAFAQLGKGLKGLQLATLYGGGDYHIQDKALRGGAQIIVGTTGRVMDHMRKGKLKIDALKMLVLDEADEMLRMGFQEDVEWILSHTPEARQTTLFSATMPKAIRQISNKYLKDKVEIDIKTDSETAKNIKQHYVEMPGPKKLPVLKRLLEALDYEGMLIFVRTKTATTEVADGLKSLGLKVEALNGDIAQAQRKQIVANLKQAKIDIVVATDVAARGIDIPRLSCVINYDMPHDVETYIHRIGRTGRAGRQGETILFVKSNERRMLSAIGQQTKSDIQPMSVPKAKDINKKRCDSLMDNLSRIMASTVDAPLKSALTVFQQTSGAKWEDIALALSRKLDGRHGFLLDERDDSNLTAKPKKQRSNESTKRKTGEPRLSVSKRRQSDHKRTTYRLEVGQKDGVKPRHIVDTIANEGGIHTGTIGNIEINKRYTIVELSADIGQRAMRKLKNSQLFGKALNMSSSS